MRKAARSKRSDYTSEPRLHHVHGDRVLEYIYGGHDLLVGIAARVLTTKNTARIGRQ